MLHSEQTATPRLLLVDDDEDTLYSTAELLSHFGADVHAFTSGADALAELGHWLPDFVLTDLDMPGMNGLEFLERIRALGLDALRVIAITGKADAGTESKLERAGFALYLAKPADLIRLFDFLGMPSESLRLH